MTKYGHLSLDSTRCGPSAPAVTRLSPRVLRAGSGRGGGQVFAGVCICCGLLLASLREFIHYCPQCGARLGAGKPKLSAKDLAIIAYVFLFQVAVATFFIFCVKNKVILADPQEINSLDYV